MFKWKCIGESWSLLIFLLFWLNGSFFKIIYFVCFFLVGGLNIRTVLLCRDPVLKNYNNTVLCLVYAGCFLTAGFLCPPRTRVLSHLYWKQQRKQKNHVRIKGWGNIFRASCTHVLIFRAYVLIVKIISSLFRCIASSNWTYSVSNDLCQISYYRFMDRIKIDMRSTDINLSMQNWFCAYQKLLKVP